MSQLRAGALLSYLSIFISIVIALVYTPIMIRLLGQSEFGLYSLIGSIAAYFSVMDMGLGNAMVRFTARNRAIGDNKAEAKLNGLFLLLYSIIGILTVLVGLIVYNNIDYIFSAKLSALELEKAKIMIIILIINFSVSFPLSIFGSIIRAYEKFVVDNIVSIVRIVMSPLLILPILVLGYGSIAMVIITTVVNISCLLFTLFYSVTKLKVKFYIGKIEIGLLKEILGYSFFVFLNVIVDQIFWKTDQVILGIVAGTAVVAVYAIAMQFITLYMRFSTAIANLFLPKVSIMEAKKASNEEFTREMIKFGRIQYIIIAYILSGFIVFGNPFIKVWAGEGYQKAYYIVLIVMIPLTIPLIQNIGISILQAKNMHGFRSITYMIIAVLNVIISIPLAKYFGGIGAALATSTSLLIGHIIIMNIYYYKRIGINIPKFWRNIGMLTIPIILSILLVYGFNVIFPKESLLIILFEIVLFSAFYFLFVWRFGMNSYEKNIFISFINRIKGIVR